MLEKNNIANNTGKSSKDDCRTTLPTILEKHPKMIASLHPPPACCSIPRDVVIVVAATMDAIIIIKQQQQKIILLSSKQPMSMPMPEPLSLTLSHHVMGYYCVSSGFQCTCFMVAVI